MIAYNQRIDSGRHGIPLEPSYKEQPQCIENPTAMLPKPRLGKIISIIIIIIIISLIISIIIIIHSIIIIIIMIITLYGWVSDSSVAVVASLGVMDPVAESSTCNLK